jgi:hypothetical protein
MPYLLRSSRRSTSGKKNRKDIFSIVAMLLISIITHTLAIYHHTYCKMYVLFP